MTDELGGDRRSDFSSTEPPSSFDNWKDRLSNRLNSALKKLEEASLR